MHLIIIPGWRHTAHDWKLVSQALDRHDIPHTVLDLPGFGNTPVDATIRTFADLCNWCERAITEVTQRTAEDIHLFGHSCGGRIAATLVANGLTVETLTLCGSPNLYRPTWKVRTLKLLAKICRPIKWLIPAQVRRKFRADDYTDVQHTALADLYLDVIKDDQTDTISTINTRTFLLWGALDTAAPVHIGQELERLLPHATLDIIPNQGHNLHIEKPELVAAKIKGYVTA